MLHRLWSMLLITCLAVLSVSVVAAADWNTMAIQWHSYDDGVQLAAAERRPVMLVFHSEGCGACDEYSELFFDPAIVKASKPYVMILMDDDENEDISLQYALDGSYVPRTYFLDPDATVLPVTIGKPDSRFLYYLGPQGADVLAGFMLAALKLSTP